MDNPNETFKSRNDRDKEAFATHSQLIALDHIVKSLDTTYIELVSAALGYLPPVKNLTCSEARRILRRGNHMYNNRKMLTQNDRKTLYSN